MTLVPAGLRSRTWTHNWRREAESTEGSCGTHLKVSRLKASSVQSAAAVRLGAGPAPPKTHAHPTQAAQPESPEEQHRLGNFQPHPRGSSPQS